VVDLRGEQPPVVLAEKPDGKWTRGPGSVTGAGRFVLSPDGRWLAQGMGFGNRPVVWETATGRRVKELEGETGVVVFGGDSRWLMVGTARQYDVYSVSTWARVRQWSRDEISSSYGAAALAGDGTWAAVAPTRRTVRLVNLKSGDPLADLQTPARQVVHSLRLSADGRTLAAALADDSVLVWELEALRAQLRPLALDWSLAPAQPTGQAPAATSARRGLSPLGLGLGLVGVAVLAAGFILRRHRNVVREYLATEATAEQRSRELEHATVELLHSQKMRALGTLAAGIAHDFNNLLSVIRMSNKLVGREVPANAEVREHVANIEEAVQQGKHLVGSMLGYSRPQSDEAAPQDLDEIVEETVALLSKEFLSGITLTLELDRHLPPVRLGGGRIEQILLNLVVNASEAMKGEGKLRLASRVRTAPEACGVVLAPQPAPRYAELAVADSGPGIPPDVLPRIFEPFFTTKHDPNRRGTGLGLSLVYNLAEQDGLGLAVESGPGRGTCFRLLIPLATDEPGVRHSHSASPPRSA
jgi:signal transduction histidine kinase